MLSAWGALLTQHQKVHRLSGKTLPVRIAGIELSLLDCVPTKNRHELMGSRSIFGGDGCARFAQSVGGAVRQPCLIAPISHFVSEAIGSEGFAEVGHYESELPWRRCINGRL
jgi:hypothetical protein